MAFAVPNLSGGSGMVRHTSGHAGRPTMHPHMHPAATRLRSQTIMLNGSCVDGKCVTIDKPDRSAAAPANRKDAQVANAKGAVENPADIAVIIPWFQAVEFWRPLANMLLVLNELEAMGAQVYVAEVTIGNQGPKFAHRANAFHFRTNAAVWHKENLVRAAVRRLPQHIQKVVILDKDVLIRTKDWLRRTSALLDTADFVQPFQTVCRWDVEFSRCRQRSNGLAYMMHQGCSIEKAAAEGGIDCGVPGYAIAMHRAFIEEVGLLEANIIGGGDKLFMEAVLDVPLTRLGRDTQQYLQAVHVPYEEFRGNAATFLGRRPKVDFLHQVTAWHCFHGPEGRRQHQSRKQLLIESNFSLDDLYKNEDGMWAFHEPDKWTPIFRKYFEGRDEDAVA